MSPTPLGPPAPTIPTTPKPHRARLWWAALAAVAAMVAAVPVATAPANAESNGGVRVMPLGDSITDGFNVAGGYRIELWQRFTAGGYRIDFVGSQFNGPSSLGDHDHEGHSGWTIAQIDANVVNWLRATNPRTVLLHIGTNDMYGDTSGAPARLATLVDRITNTAPNADVFVATIIPKSGADNQVRGFNAAIPGIVQTRAAAGKHVHLVDMYRALTLSDLADGVHPNATGYRKMAVAWYDALRAVPGSIGGDTPPTSAPPTTPPPTTAADDSPADHPAALGRLPGHVHGQRLEQRTHRVRLGDQHEQQRDKRVGSGVHAAQRPDHHRRLERQLLPDQRRGDGPQRLLQRHHRTEHLGRHRLPGHPHRQRRPADDLHAQRHRLRGRLTPTLDTESGGGEASSTLPPQVRVAQDA